MSRMNILAPIAASLVVAVAGVTHHVSVSIQNPGGQTINSHLKSPAPDTASAQGASGDGSTPAPAATSAGGDAQSAAGPGQMSEATFWGLIAETRAAAHDDTGEQSQLLEERLSKLSPQAILGFERIRHGLDKGAYTWDMWGAAYVIEDGCSDDCFRDFRGYLISLGRSAYENALQNPDSLAPVVQDAENGDWENADDPAPDAYSSATGNDYPGDTSDLSGDPRGQAWDDSNEQLLIQRYPALAARFR
jgi:hypothetical protein